MRKLLELPTVDYALGGSKEPQIFFNSCEVDYMFECPAVDPSSQSVPFAGVGTRIGVVVKAAGVC